MAKEAKSISNEELTQAVNLLMEREESRVAKARRRKRRRLRRQHAATRQSMVQLTKSIETIKWSVVGIATVMALSLLILIAVVWQIGNEAQRIKGEVEQIKAEAETIVRQIEHEADQIRDKLQHPMRTLGGALGGQLDTRIQGLIGAEPNE